MEYPVHHAGVFKCPFLGFFTPQLPTIAACSVPKAHALQVRPPCRSVPKLNSHRFEWDFAIWCDAECHGWTLVERAFFSFYFQLNFKLEVHSNLLDYPPRTSYVVFAVTEECPSVIGSSLYIGDASDRHFIGVSRLFSFSVWRPWGGIDCGAIFV